MRIREAALEPGGVKARRGSWEIIDRADDAPRPIFRSTLYLDFECGAGAESLQIQETETRLEGAFLPLEYDLRALKDTRIRSFDATGLLVEAPVAQYFLEFVVRSEKIPAAGYELRLFMIEEDGRPAEHPVQLVANGQRMERRYDGGEYIILPGKDSSAPGLFEIDPKHQGIFVLAGSPHFWIGRSMQHFLIRIMSPDGAYLRIGPDDLAQLRVQGYPTNPRIGIALPPLDEPSGVPRPEDTHFFWRAPGQIRTEGSGGAGNFRDDSHFTPELTRLLRRYLEMRPSASGADSPPAPLPSTLTLALVFESDSPCEVQDFGVQIDYLLERSSFPDDSAKQLLRFDPGRHLTRSLEIAVPAGITPRRANLPLDLHLPADRDLSNAAGQRATGAAARDGIHLRDGVVALQGFSLENPVLATGVTLELLPLSSSAEAYLQLHEDHNGSPGRVLAHAACMAGEAGAICWPALSFPDPVLLASRAYWLSLRTRSGSLLWLTGSAPESRLYLQHDPSAPSGRAPILLPGIRALHTLRSRNSTASSAPPLVVRYGTAEAELVRDEESGAFHVDLLAAMQAFLRGASEREGLLTFALQVEATGPGDVTFYPPTLLYDLGT